MDISIPINNVKLNIRVSVLLETPDGFVFEKDKDGYYSPVGGRIKINETSVEATKREVEEELNIKINDTEYIATIENFFKIDMPFHEINIVHYAKIDYLECPKDFYVFDEKSIQEVSIKPEIIKEMIVNKNFEKSHYVVKDY